MRMADWLTPEEQDQVNDENFWQWYDVALEREQRQENLQGCFWTFALVFCLAMAVLGWRIAEFIAQRFF